MLLYSATAAGLGVGWFIVLLIPGTTRDWLLAEPLLNLGCLVAASVLVAVMCRRFIARADTLGEHLLRAFVVPYLGCFVFLSLWNAWIWIQTQTRGGLANLHDTLSLYAFGMVAAVVSIFVVVPYGLLCQRVMSAVLRRTEG